MQFRQDQGADNTSPLRVMSVALAPSRPCPVFPLTADIEGSLGNGREGPILLKKAAVATQRYQ
jgi:hypothetical protein